MGLKLAAYCADIDSMRDRRVLRRSNLIIKAKVARPNDQTIPPIVGATVEDRSDRGVSIRLCEPIPVGQELRIQWPYGTLSGTVQRCQYDGKVFVIAVQVTEPSP